MSAVATIRLNRMELKLADTDDPVAQKTSWDPLKPGGANFRTQELVAVPNGWAVENSIGGLAFVAVFAAFGALFVLVGLTILIGEGNFGGLVFAAVGSLFVAVPVWMLRADAPMRFDLDAGVYHRGPAYRAGTHPAGAQGPLASIHALQLVQERIRSSSSGGSSTFTSHELNLVFADGSRANVLDHGDGDAVVEAAKQLAGALGVPVWQAAY